MNTWIQRSFAPLKRVLPRAVSGTVRSMVTAFFVPFYTAFRNGHVRSSFANRAVDRHGLAVPWYTYPCIDFLRVRDFSKKRILEFGAGQSTIWWGSVARSVLAFEDNLTWHDALLGLLPSNVTLQLVNASPEALCLEAIRTALTNQERCFDVIVIDGLCRSALVPLAMDLVHPEGAIICDNSEGYGIQLAFQNSAFSRIDFYGIAPGISLPHCTSIFFRDGCFLLSNSNPIARSFE